MYKKEVKGHLMGERWWAGVIRNRSSEEVGPGLVLGGRGMEVCLREREDYWWNDGREVSREHVGVTETLPGIIL